jgi:NTP pyrophosphatase (non-canonical NTP hydrolase)
VARQVPEIYERQVRNGAAAGGSRDSGLGARDQDKPLKNSSPFIFAYLFVPSSHQIITSGTFLSAMPNRKTSSAPISDIDEITTLLIRFRDERNWAQFHNSKDLALALSIEAAELNELFLWKDAREVDEEKLRDELADVFAFAFLLAHKHGLNVKKIVKDKVRKNAAKYPVRKSRNTAKKYNEL